MSRKLASIVEIATCDPIPDTDRLSVATMAGKGWNVVTGRDEFKPGDIAVYFEIDSYLPFDDQRYEFLKDRCLRKFVSKSGQVLKQGMKIKTCKLRGVVSQGLLMPMRAFPELDVRIPGEDVTQILKVEHYDEVAEALRPATGGNPVAADAIGKFPSDFIPKTDEERIQNLGEYFQTMKGRVFEVTEKNDGSSVTMFMSKTIDHDDPYGVCSRNLRLKRETDNGVPVPWQLFQKYDMETNLEHACAEMECELAFQGELVGPGVNGNRDLYPEWEWHVFRVYDISNQRFLNPHVAEQLCKKYDIPYVPVIVREMKVFDDMSTVADLLKFAEGKTTRGHEREGLVFKSVDELPYVSFKAVSNRYLLKQED